MDRLLELFAGILEAPGEDLGMRVRECTRAAAAVGVPAADLDEFARFVENAPEDAIASLYGSGGLSIGRQLYGDGYGRSMLLLDLQKRYRRHGFETGEEPADHLAVLLRFLSECDDAAEREELVREIMVPGLEAMVANEESPAAGTFAPVLRALTSALREQVGS